MTKNQQEKATDEAAFLVRRNLCDNPRDGAIKALNKVVGKASPEDIEVVLQALAMSELLESKADTDCLDTDSTTTQFWRTRPLNEDKTLWECTKMVWSQSANAWLSSVEYKGRTAAEARALAAKTVCPVCRYGDCFDPRHQ